MHMFTAAIFPIAKVAPEPNSKARAGVSELDPAIREAATSADPPDTTEKLTDNIKIVFL